MEAHNHFTCIAYNNVDFLIQSKYVLFGIYLGEGEDDGNIVFNRETLPHIRIGHLLEKEFLCESMEGYNAVLVMNKRDFANDICKQIEDFTETAFPMSGNLAISVNSSVSSKIVDIETLRLIPQSIRERQLECGVCAIGFANKKQILISPDNLLRKFFSAGLIKKR